MAQTVPLSDLGALDKIGQGGQGIVYRAPSAYTTFAKSMVFKQYKKVTLALLDFRALEAMPVFLESLPYRDGAKLISLAAWPCTIVKDAGMTTGFLMPSIPDEFFTQIWTNKPTPSTVAAEFQHLLNDSHVLAMRFKGAMITDRQRYELLSKAASALSFFHERGVCVGDISPKNILYALSPTPAVYFIDCDAMRVKGISLSPQVETPGWGVPHGEEKATVYSDRYKLGLMALRLLAGNQGTMDPSVLPDSVPAELRNVIAQALNSTPAKRPELAAWESALTQAIATAPRQQTTPTYLTPSAFQTPNSSPKVTTASRRPAQATPAPVPLIVQPSQPIHARMWLWVPAVLSALAIIGLLISRVGGGGTTTQTVTATPTATLPAVTETVPPTYSARTTVPTAAGRPAGDLNLSQPMSTPPCDGRGIVVLSSVTTPGRYAEGVEAALRAFPGASYLLTELTCPSLRARLDGKSIYSVYRPGGRTEPELCAAVAAAGNGAYGKWLDYTTDPDYIPCKS